MNPSVIVQPVGDLARLAEYLGRPQPFLYLVAAVAVLFLLSFAPRLPWRLRLPPLLLFIALDALLLYVTFGVSPEVTDFDYGAPYLTPTASIGWTDAAKSSETVCVPLASFNPIDATKVVDSECTNGGSPQQNYFVSGARGDQFCYNVTAEPDDGQRCRITGRFRIVPRLRRQGILQFIHTELGMDRRIVVAADGK